VVAVRFRIIRQKPIQLTCSDWRETNIMHDFPVYYHRPIVLHHVVSEMMSLAISAAVGQIFRIRVLSTNKRVDMF
jgi:hypothetical protein